MIQFAALFAGSALTAQLLNPGQVGSLHGWWSVFSGTGSLRDTGAGASTPSGVSLRAPGVATGTWAVTQLDDMSGNGRHFIQGTAANQPILNQVTLVNGVPPVKFDGVDDFMKTAAFTAISQRSGWPGRSGPITRRTCGPAATAPTRPTSSDRAAISTRARRAASSPGRRSTATASTTPLFSAAHRAA
jgi:hypothetical protein